MGSHVLIEEVTSGEVEDSTVILILGNQPIIQSREGLTWVGSPRLTTLTAYKAYNAREAQGGLGSLWEDGAGRARVKVQGVCGKIQGRCGKPGESA